MSEIEKNEDISETDSFMNNHFYAESNITDKSSISVTDDYRVLWVQEKILNFLGLNNAYDIFSELMNNNHRYYKKKLYNFLNTNTYEIANLEFKQVFFYKTYRDEIVQDEISVWEEDKKKKVKDQKNLRKSTQSKSKPENNDLDKGEEAMIDSIESSTAIRSNQSIGSESEGVINEEFNEENDYEANSLDLIMKQKNQSTHINEYFYESKMFVPPSGEKHKYVLKRKLVDRIVRVPVLHCFFGEIDGSDSLLHDQQIIYILRSSDSAIPIYDTQESCWAEFPRHVIVGSIQGQFLITMGQILKDVFLPLVEKQFRGPEAAQDKTAKDVMTFMMETPGIEKAAETLGNLTKLQGTTFMPPSNVRRISLLAEKMKNEEERLNSIMMIEDGSFQPKIARKSKDTFKTYIEPSKMEFLEYLSKLVESVKWLIVQ